MIKNLKKNKYFTNMAHSREEYREARAARSAEKDEIIKRYGVNNDEMKAWETREKQFSFPFSYGQLAALRSWENSVNHNSGEFECEDLPVEEHIASFLHTLKAARIKTFVVTERSTALMANLYLIANMGWKMEEVCVLKRDEGSKPVYGIRFSVN